jgi:hypothetical protein
MRAAHGYARGALCSRGTGITKRGCDEEASFDAAGKQTRQENKRGRKTNAAGKQTRQENKTATGMPAAVREGQAGRPDIPEHQDLLSLNSERSENDGPQKGESGQHCQDVELQRETHQAPPSLFISC